MSNNKIPTNLKECFIVLKEMAEKTGKSVLDDFKNSDTCEWHHGLGRMLRNNWGLWWAEDWPEKYNKQETELHKYMVGLGLHHADDMSGLILTSFQRHLKGEPLDIEGQVAHYQNYWKEQREMDEKKYQEALEQITELEVKVMEIAQQRDAYDNRRREAMEKTEEWRDKYHELEARVREEEGIVGVGSKLTVNLSHNNQAKVTIQRVEKIRGGLTITCFNRKE